MWLCCFMNILSSTIRTLKARCLHNGLPPLLVHLDVCDAHRCTGNLTSGVGVQVEWRFTQCACKMYSKTGSWWTSLQVCRYCYRVTEFPKQMQACSQSGTEGGLVSYGGMSYRGCTATKKMCKVWKNNYFSHYFQSPVSEAHNDSPSEVLQVFAT